MTIPKQHGHKLPNSIEPLSNYVCIWIPEVFVQLLTGRGVDLILTAMVKQYIIAYGMEALGQMKELLLHLLIHQIFDGETRGE